MTSHFVLLFSLGLCPLINASQNVTIEVPDGTTSHGDPHMLCTPATSLDILIFFFSNYIVHAVTVKTYPGESRTGRYIACLAALFFPTLGLVRGLNAWARHAVFAEGALEQAARSGALCMVVRDDDWEPEDGAQMDEIRVVRRITGGTNVGLPVVYPERIRRPAIWVQRLVRRLRRWVEDHSGSNPSIAAISAALSTITSPWRKFNEKHLDSNECSALTDGVHTMLRTYGPGYSTESSLFWLFPDTIGFYIDSRTVHGASHLPLGYSLAHVPRNARVQQARVTDPKVELCSSSNIPQASVGVVQARVTDRKMELCSSSNIPKAAVGVVQAIYSSFTLFRAQGAQIHQYGYAAFGLTVLPYTVMTLVNLVGNLLTPDYSTLYLVASDILLEAEKRGAVFEGIVGKLVSVDGDAEQPAEPTGWPRHLEWVRRQIFRKVSQDSLGETRTEAVIEHCSVSDVAGSHAGNTETVDLEMNHTSGSEVIRGDGQVNHPATVGTPHSTKILLIDQPRRNSPAQRLPDSHVRIQIPACPPFARHQNPPLPSIATVDEISLGGRVIFVFMTAVGVNLVIVGIFAFLSDRFSTGDSTKAQRGWTMSWFMFGLIGGIYPLMASVTPGELRRLGVRDGERAGKLFSAESISSLAVLCVYSFPAIAGFVVVGQMIREYGTCIRF